jgi:hypothetical protein
MPAVNPTLYRLYPRWKERKYEESGGNKKPRKVDVMKARIRFKKDGSASLKIIWVIIGERLVPKNAI